MTRLCLLAGGAVLVVLVAAMPASASAERAIDTLCSRLVDTLEPSHRRDVLDGVAIRVNPSALPGSPTMVTEFGSRVATRCREALARAGHPVAVLDSPTHFGLRGFSFFADIALSMRDGLLAFNMEFSSAPHGWLSARPSLTRRTIEASVPADAEVRAVVGVLSPISGAGLRVRRLRLPDAHWVALGVLPRRDRVDLALISDDGLIVMEVPHSTGDLIESERKSLSSLQDADLKPRRVAAVLTRRPHGHLQIDTSAFRRTVDIDGSGEDIVLTESERRCGVNGFESDGVCVWLVEGRDYFHVTETHERGTTAPSYYAIRESALTQADGTIMATRARANVQGGLEVEREGNAQFLPAAGFTVGIADLEQDGDPELLVSSDQPMGDGDALTLIRRIDQSVLWSSGPIAGSIVAMAEGDLDEDGFEELLAIEAFASGRNPQLWIIGR